MSKNGFVHGCPRMECPVIKCPCMDMFMAVQGWNAQFSNGDLLRALLFLQPISVSKYLSLAICNKTSFFYLIKRPVPIRLGRKYFPPDYSLSMV
jgi:hypothetical protein